MAFADILVHLDDTKNCSSRLDAAISLAARFKSRLTGLYVITHQYYEPRSGRVEKDAEAVRQKFEKKVAQAGIEAAWQCADWSVIGVGMAEIISHYAHYADLVIIGQSKGKTKDSYIPSDLPERLVLVSGRPVLIIPFAGVFTAIGERVLVTWKPGRESTRAVNDALPLLKKAKRVDILVINTFETVEDDGDSYGKELCQHLGRHGVKATAEKMTVSNTSVGDAMLNRACEESFDLLVMGAYAHNPQGKIALGVVARHMLDQMTVPVLMSH